MSKIREASGLKDNNEEGQKKLTPQLESFLCKEGFKYNEYICYKGAYLYDETNEAGIHIYATIEPRGVIFCHLTRQNEDDSFEDESFSFNTKNFETIYDELVTFIEKNTSENNE